MEDFLLVSVERSVKFDSLCRQMLRPGLSYSLRASIVSEMSRLFDENVQASVFYFEQCAKYQRNLRNKNKSMSNSKTKQKWKKMKTKNVVGDTPFCYCCCDWCHTWFGWSLNFFVNERDS